MEKKFAMWCLVTGQKEDCLNEKLDALPPAWEAAAEGIEKELFKDAAHASTAATNLVGWPSGVLTKDDVRSRFKLAEGLDLDAGQLMAIEGIGEKYNAELRFRADAWENRMLDAANTLWLSGKFERGPFVLPPYQGTDAMHTITITYNKWCVTLIIKKAEFPWLAEDVASLNVVKKARDDEIQGYLKSLR